jgi:glycine/D-amino acid oxidase-like deaminating enzyme/nitrite reductase/ring-hydroxylating ferredoxin subunit
MDHTHPAGHGPDWTDLTHGARSGLSTSLWMDTAPAEHLRPLERDLSADCCVIGAGISGLTTAYLLLLSGRQVAVLDDGPIGSGETGRTTAHFVTALDDRFEHLLSWRGADITRLAAQSHAAAIDMVEEIVAREEIACDFARLDGYLFQPDGRHAGRLAAERDAAGHTGLAGVRMIERAPWPDFDTGPCLVFPRQAQLHPLRYLHGLARAVRRLGGEIHTGTRVEKIEGRTQVKLKTHGGPTVTAKEVVHATNAPLDAPAEIYLKEFPYRSYVIAAEIPAGMLPAGLYWDNQDSYHYLRTQITDRGERLIVGGEDHATGKADDGRERHARLEAWARERFPMLGEVVYRWSGQVFEPVDGLGLIGRYLDRPHQYIISGDSGNGMTHGTLGARLVADLVTGRENPWEKAYDPSRTPRNVKHFLQMGIPAASSYARKVTAGHRDPSDIAPDAGAIVEIDGEKVALYRDAAGEEHRVSALCTHRGCVVAWNGTEKTWDCPCHGSRFATNGELLTGPASAPLEQVSGGKRKRPAA